MSCDHSTLSLDETVRHTAFEGDNGLPRQITLEAKCDECGSTVAVDYNIAFVDGDEV